MATKLGLYNGALKKLGERKLASLSEEREPRFAIDDVYDQALLACLEAGLWNFAMRAVEIEESASVEPTFGYTSAFEVPSDWVRTDAVSFSPTFKPPLTDYAQEQGYWWANGTPLYVRYVSKDTDYGLDLASWPATFTHYVEAHIALQICEQITSSATKFDKIEKLETKLKHDAKTKDASNESVRFKPTGSWVMSRRGGRTDRRRWDGTTS